MPSLLKSLIGKTVLFGGNYYYQQGGSPLEQLLAQFAGAGVDSGVERAAGGTYWVHQYLSDDLYWSAELRPRSGLPGSGNITALTNSYIRRIVSVKADNDAAITYSGAGWTARTAGAGTFGGFYRRTSTTGNYVECTTVSNVTVCGVMTFANNSGISLVTIDGDATLANLVTTAQQLVDSGAAANTILVANGGTLNPTDRCIDQSTVGTSGLILLADNLAAGVHTIRLTCTGYKATAAPDVRNYFSGFFFNAPAGTRLNASAIATIPVTGLLTSFSVWEYALNCLPSGAGSGGSTFVGNGHGYDIQTALTFTVDGNSTTLNEWDVYDGVIEATRTSNLRHPATGAATVAEVEMTYTMHPATGLTTNLSLTWRTAGVSTLAYVSMLPVSQPPFDKGSMPLATLDYLLTNDNDSEAVNLQDSATYFWDADGDYGMMANITNLAAAVNNWTNTNVYHWIQDRAVEGSVLLNKGYLTRVSGSETLSDGLIWLCDTNYRLQRFPSGGANAALAR